MMENRMTCKRDAPAISVRSWRAQLSHGDGVVACQKQGDKYNAVRNSAQRATSVSPHVGSGKSAKKCLDASCVCTTLPFCSPRQVAGTSATSSLFGGNIINIATIITIVTFLLVLLLL